VAETDVSLFRNGTGHAERLQAFADGSSRVASGFDACFNCKRNAEGVSPNRVVERDGLNAFHNRFNVNTLFGAKGFCFFETCNAGFG